jgi:hypothetical protein
VNLTLGLICFIFGAIFYLRGEKLKSAKSPVVARQEPNDLTFATKILHLSCPISIIKQFFTFVIFTLFFGLPILPA